MRSCAGQLAVLLAGSALAAACTSTPSAPAESPSASTVGTAVAAPTATAVAAAPTLATTATSTSAPDAVAFFRSLQAGCAQHAAATGNPVVEPDRFAGATQVRDLGGGSYLVRDGQGTELVVQPAKGVVLPASGRAGDLMPSPYGFGCSEKVFLGGSD
jgi:hypothetical protein